ncbi:MAG: PEP-CTERM sorting domain-containing protein [bacterium]|nr:PEP-CTERM sorting domain-containing protein [bacterium]
MSTRRTRLLLTCLSIVVGLAMPVQSVWASVVGDALVIRYTHPSLGTDLENTLSAFGLTTTTLYPAAGDVAAELAANSYDQIYIMDMPGYGGLPPMPSAADVAAVDTWHQAHPSVILMGTAGGIDASNDVAQHRFAENVAQNFDSFGGGLFVGADHAPYNVEYVNEYLGGLGYDLFTGIHGDGAVTGPAGSSWYNAPNTILTSTMWWGTGAPAHWSVAAAPYGLQPNGRVLDQLLWKTTDSLGNPTAHVNLISGELTLVPEPSTVLLLGMTAVGLLPRRRRR